MKMKTNTLYTEQSGRYLTENSMSIRKTKRLMLFAETIVVYNNIASTHSYISCVGTERGGSWWHGIKISVNERARL
jgi:hypothetical protein